MSAGHPKYQKTVKRNARKSIKGLKDLDSSLVSNKNFSETLWPSSWALGQAT